LKLNVEKIAKKAINESKKRGAILFMCIDGFQTESEAMYLRDMLWYASKKGVQVTFIPKKYSQYY